MFFEIFSWNLSVLISLNNFFVSKNKYALDILQKIGMSTCKLVDILSPKVCNEIGVLILYETKFGLPIEYY